MFFYQSRLRRVMLHVWVTLRLSPFPFLSSPSEVFLVRYGYLFTPVIFLPFVLPVTDFPGVVAKV